MADEPAHEASQAAQIRALQDILPYLLNKIEATEAQIRDVARLVEIVKEPGEEEESPPPGDGPRHKRDRHGLRVIPGGLAAFAPVALLAHGGLAAVLLPVAHRLLRHRTVCAAASVTALAAGAALAVPAVGAMQIPVPVPTIPARGAVHAHQQPAPLRAHPAPAGRRLRRRDYHGDDDADDAFVRYSVPHHRHGHAGHRGHHRDHERGTRRTSSVRNPGPRCDAGRTVTPKHADTRDRWVDSGSAVNSSVVMLAWASMRRPAASRPARSRNSDRRPSMPSRRARSSCRRSPLAGSAMAASASVLWAASAANCAASPGASGACPAGLAGWFSRRTVRWVT